MSEGIKIASGNLPYMEVWAMNMNEERRKRERFEMKQVLELKTGDSRVIPAAGVNISEGGVLCRTGEEIAAGTFVSFMFTIRRAKSDITVECDGVVLRCVPAAGGKFDVAIDLTDRESD